MYKQGILNFRASAGTGFRSPSLKELYFSFDHFGEFTVDGNPQLKPESSKYISGSIEFSKPWNNSSVTVYRNVLTDMITTHLISVPDAVEAAYQYGNVASASVNGIDLLSKQKLVNGVWLSAGYSYVHALDNESGLQLYGTAKHSGNISADYNFRKKNYSFTAQLYCQFMGERIYQDADGSTNMTGLTIAGASLFHRNINGYGYQPELIIYSEWLFLRIMISFLPGEGFLWE